MRIGHGYDVHQFADGRKCIIGGVEIPYEKGLLGHSDADVLLHAVSDALLGAAALGDIGTHFPDTDPAFKGIDSTLLLQKTVGLLQQQGWQVNNADLTIVLERPKLKDYKPLIQKKLAELLLIADDQVSVKAKTNEGMGFLGRGEGVAVAVAVTIKR